MASAPCPAGHVDTRLRKLESGEYDAIILAGAGVLRLGLEDACTFRHRSRRDVPGRGAGALAIEIRRGDQQTKTNTGFLNDADTHAAIDCERALLGSLGGGCQVPIGAYAEKRGGRLYLRAMVGRPMVVRSCAKQADGTDGVKLGAKRRKRCCGAAVTRFSTMYTRKKSKCRSNHERKQINTGTKKAAVSPKNEEPLSGWRILTTRASKQSGGLAETLREMGAEVIEIPTIEIKPPSSYKRSMRRWQTLPNTTG